MGDIVRLPELSQKRQQEVNIAFDKEWALIDAIVPTKVAEDFLKLTQTPPAAPKQQDAHLWLAVLFVLWLFPSPVNAEDFTYADLGVHPIVIVILALLASNGVRAAWRAWREKRNRKS